MDFDRNKRNEIKMLGSEYPEILEAGSIYLLMKKDVPLSRASRLLWLINHIGQIVTLPKNPNWGQNDFELLSVVPMDPAPAYWRPESNYLFQYKITSRTKVWFVAHRYKLAICLDLSPSQSTVDVQRGMLLLDQLMDSFKDALRQIAEPLVIPGSSMILKPLLYVTVIAHTPFFTTPAQQVLIKGVKLTAENVDTVIDNVEKQLRVLEQKISDVTKLAHQQIDQQLDHFDDDYNRKLPNIPMVSPDASFINMLRYSMLALSLLPENSLGNILVVTDGVICMPDVNILESLLQQLHFDSYSVSFLMIGSSYHPHCNFGYVAYRDILHFISTATFGFYSENYYQNETVYLSQNFVHHQQIFLWTLNSANQNEIANHSPNEWSTTNVTFNGTKVPVLLKKKQAEDKINASLMLVLSRRLREGYTLDNIFYENNRLEISLRLPWKTHTYLIYNLITQWPSTQTLVNFHVSIKAPYESLHDTTCPIKKQLRSAYRQAVVERFLSAISQLTTADVQMAQHFNSFTLSNIWFILPESVRSGMPVFTVQPNTIETCKYLFTANDNAFPKFSAIWQPICQLEITNWRKWFHIHKISIILHHDQPLPLHLHTANTSGRFTMVQCRQAVAALYGTLSDWASFVLIDNQTYVKFLYRTGEKIPNWFCIIRITSKLPCPVLTLGFVTGTPGQVRNQVCEDLRIELRQLTYSVRANTTINDKSPTKSKESSCCTILVKPLEKILIRYEKMPSDLSTVIFPDGTQPTFEPTNSLRRHSSVRLAPGLAPAALLTTLSRYLHHRRWVWGVSYPTNPQLSHTAVARILNTVTRMRLKEGFRFAHSSSGIINMVIEVEMKPLLEDGADYINPDEKLSRCIIQYVMFPPHNAVAKRYDQFYDYLSDSEDEMEYERIEELQLVTEVWIEPQFGFVTNCPTEQAKMYLENVSYDQIADAIGNIDSKCISSLLTVEHLSLMCQQKRQLNFSKTSHFKPIEAPAHHPEVQFYNISTNSIFLKENSEMVVPIIEERIHKKPFAFNLLNILPKCRQAKLIFSTFTESPHIVQSHLESNTTTKSPNNLLLESLFDQLQILNDQSLHMNENDSKSFYEILLARSVADEDFGLNIENQPSNPLWRCFIKGVSDKQRVLLTFIPASVRDLILLNSQKGPFRLPILIYDCSLTALINNFINSESDSLKDIFEDHTYKKGVSSEDLYGLNAESTSKQGKDKADEKICLRHACNLLVMAHSNCFVTCTFRSLHLKYPLHSGDVDIAVSLCQNTIVSIDISKYIKTVCGHLKFKKASSPNRSYCYDLRYFHTMIKEKFRRTLESSFKSVPSNSNIYYSSPAQKPKNIDDESESDNWSDIESSDESRKKSPSIPDILDLTPLFLHFKCTVNKNEPIPIRVLPTCLFQLIRDIDIDFNFNELSVSLDIICSTLPTSDIDDEPVSFESSSPIAPSSPSEKSFQSDIIENIEVTAIPYQCTVIATLEEEIKWQLQDEIVTALLDIEPITSETLNFVTNHINNSTHKTSCQLEKVTLNFVYGPSESLGRFSQEFNKLPVPDYKLVREGDYYFLTKDYPSVSTLVTKKKVKNRVVVNSPRGSIVGELSPVTKDEVLSDVQTLMFDLLNEVESNNELRRRLVRVTEDSFSEPECDPNTQHDWLKELDKRRNILPNFWMIMKVREDIIDVYFHCRFLELHKTQVSGYLAVHRSVISAIKSLCKHVNQFLLLQSLHDTKTCDRLLEAEEVSRDWNSQTTTPILTRNTSLARLKQVDEPEDPKIDVTYLDLASLKYMPGFFACAVVWETHFCLHPRLKTSNNVRAGLSRGIQALRTVLNKFSVVNRNNMFVYRDNSSNVFYLRLHENASSAVKNSSIEENMSVVTRSPSIASLPVGAPKNHLSNLNGIVSDLRPRVRSFGEKESQDAAAAASNGSIPTMPPEDTITLKVHGVTGAGRDVTNDLVKVLQKRLDDAVLELLSIMLERNPMCKLNQEDVGFLQKPFAQPDNIIRFSVQNHVAIHLDSLEYYLHQNLLQFLHLPKYTSTSSHSHFRDYTESILQEHVALHKKEHNMFLYNQSAASGNRGIACIAFVFLHNTLSVSPGITLAQHTFEQWVETSETTSAIDEWVIEFRIWEKGRVNIETLCSRLKLAVKHARWDLVIEKYLLTVPLCVPDPIEIREFQLNLNNSSTLSSLIRNVQSLDGGKKQASVVLHKTLSDTDVDTNPKLNVFETGDSGILHDIYTNIMQPWIQFGVDIKVPSVTKQNVRLVMTHPIETVLIELQRFIKSHTADITTKTFSQQVTIDNRIVYVPFDSRQYTVHCILIGRNFEQWKASCDSNNLTNFDVLEPKSNKVLQKFSPFFENNLIITRQRLLMVSVTSEMISFSAYNWSKERLDKLISHGENLGLWLSARVSVFNSVCAQKLGLFHNQPIVRKHLTANNPYMPNVTEPEFVARFPSVGSVSHHRQKTEQNDLNILETFRDTTMSIIGHKVIYNSDCIVRSVQELHQLRQYDRKLIEEQKKLHSMWQSRGATTHISTEPHKIQLLRQQSRVIHYCLTPFLFLEKWRIQAASTRDHLLMYSEMEDDETPWHDQICSNFFTEYKQYLQTLGFIPIRIGGSEATESTSYLQKSMLGGILVFELFFSEPFFIAKLYTLECQRIQNKASKQSMNQFILSFLDETDRIKLMMHVHSFAYDYHLRSVHSYISQDLTKGARLIPGYHLTNFLDDFIKYYSKGPNYARNLIYSEVITIHNLITSPKQLYDYLLIHEKQYQMTTFSISSDSDYFLGQVTSCPSFSYKDAQDRQHTDDLDITLIVSYFDHSNSDLILKYYLILTSPREYPKPEVERTLGKFRTVSTSKRTDDEDSIDLNEIFSEKRLEIQQESVNYLGYYSSHEQLMQQLIEKCAESTRFKIRDMIEKGMVHCRTHLLWNKLVSKQDQLSYQEFIELRDLSKLQLISEIVPEMKLLLDKQSVNWYQQLAKVLLAKYEDQHRYFVSPDSTVQHYVILHPRYLGAFVILTINSVVGTGELFAAYRESVQLDPCDISIEDRQSLINDFVNCICFHVWVGMIT